MANLIAIVGMIICLVVGLTAAFTLATKNLVGTTTLVSTRTIASTMPRDAEVQKLESYLQQERERDTSTPSHRAGPILAIPSEFPPTTANLNVRTGSSGAAAFVVLPSSCVQVTVSDEFCASATISVTLYWPVQAKFSAASI